jgi:hypothetical protein
MDAVILERAEQKLRVAAEAIIGGRLGEDKVATGLMMLEELDGDTEIGRGIKEILAAFDPSHAINEGLDRAKAEGRLGKQGRPEVDPSTDPRFAKLVECMERGESARAASLSVEVPHSTACKWLTKVYGDRWLDAFPERAHTHDNDAVYAWIVTEAPDHVVMPLQGYHLVKSGVTSQKLGGERPRNTMNANEMQGEIIAICDTSEGDALYFEEVLQSVGVQPVFPDDEHLKLDGYTEFRLVSDAELDEIMALLGADEQLAIAA